MNSEGKSKIRLGLKMLSIVQEDARTTQKVIEILKTHTEESLFYKELLGEDLENDCAMIE